MELIREPKDVDFTMESKPWTKQELIDFRKLMSELKAQKGSELKTRSSLKRQAVIRSKDKS